MKPGRGVTIVMYHYVRDLKHSRYPEIKGLDVGLFREQLAYIRRHYRVIRMEELIAAIRDGKSLPENALLLTFDDAYSDHYSFVFPILDALKIQGSFFPPAKAILEHTVLDVNKIHFILASVKDKSILVRDISEKIAHLRDRHALKTPEEYRASIDTSDRYDSPEIVFIKRILQRDLPEQARNEIVHSLFLKHVSADEAAFSQELYMSLDQIRCMRAHGMHVGSHGFNHYWLNTLLPAEQEAEIKLSLEFLKSVGCDMSAWTMCYPYGASDDSLRALVRNLGGAVGLGVEVGVADLDSDDPYCLPRLDANDLPKSAGAPPSDWTLRAAARA